MTKRPGKATGDKLRAIRTKRGWGQLQAAGYVDGLSLSAYRKYEQGTQSIPTPMLRKIVSAWGLNETRGDGADLIAIREAEIDAEQVSQRNYRNLEETVKVTYSIDSTDDIAVSSSTPQTNAEKRGLLINIPLEILQERSFTITITISRIVVLLSAGAVAEVAIRTIVLLKPGPVGGCAPGPNGRCPPPQPVPPPSLPPGISLLDSLTRLLAATSLVLVLFVFWRLLQSDSSMENLRPASIKLVVLTIAKYILGMAAVIMTQLVIVPAISTILADYLLMTYLTYVAVIIPGYCVVTLMAIDAARKRL